MPNPFETEPLQIAHRELMAHRRRYIDWDHFMSDYGRWNRHYLVLGTHKNAYDKCCRTSLIDQSESPYSMHQLARPYLKTIVYLQGGEARAIHDDGLLLRESPLYFPGPTAGDLTLIDLDGAYFNLYRNVSFDLDYDGETTPRCGKIRFLGQGELGEQKLLRNAIVGTARAEWRTDSDFGVLRKVRVGGTWRRPSLWAYVQDCLSAIAWDMRLFFGAVHIHTDGFVIPHHDLAEDAIAYLNEVWGMDASIKAQGDGFVSSLGAFRIGDEVVGEVLEYPGDHIDNMGPVENAVELREFHLECKEHRLESAW